MYWLSLLPLWFIFNTAAYLLAPLLPLLARNELGPVDNNNTFRVEPRLPKWLSWFQTPDNSLWGDAGWREKHCPNWNSYWGMVKWLWRNPAYGFEYSVLAAHVNVMDNVTYIGDPFIQDKPLGRAGYCYTRVGGYWNLMVVIRVTYGYCIKLNFGWKLKTFAELPSRLETQITAQYVFSPKISSFKQS